jgi:uncharacterized protein YndB with AHSA1/START domain
MKLANEVMASKPDNEIVTTRIIREKRDRVFKAWSDPSILSRWWGPNGFTNTINQFEFQKGGSWRFVMQGPDGKDYPNHCEFVEISDDQFISWNHLSNPNFQVAASFDDIDDGYTKVTFKMAFLNPQDCNKIKAFVIGKNEENLDRLENVLLRNSNL